MLFTTWNALSALPLRNLLHRERERERETDEEKECQHKLPNRNVE